MPRYPVPSPYYIVDGSNPEEFMLGMLRLGRLLETSVVGVFDDTGRGSRRDIELPLHQDGQYSQKLAEAQGRSVVELDHIDIVGVYCLREGKEACFTTLSVMPGGLHVPETQGPDGFQPGEMEEIELKYGQSLVFDNNRCMHGRRGTVGERLLLRMWLRNDFLRGKIPPPPDAK
ncbi:MAG TPA: hypothetical protein VJG48_02515 [Candidatus Paceibacterota bacterium]